MGDVELALFVTVYVVMVQAILSSWPTYKAEDCLVTESLLDVDDQSSFVYQFVLSSPALHDLHL